LLLLPPLLPPLLLLLRTLAACVAAQWLFAADVGSAQLHAAAALAAIGCLPDR
jgi:hypothetical protein